MIRSLIVDVVTHVFKRTLAKRQHAKFRLPGKCLIAGALAHLIQQMAR